ncbi:MAG: hypothetical protein JF616_11895 [Fibrobacteres bacterium]|jgi:hypothetical protein|nr:hypothetical protein [Fibrobacterota bacterium]
MRRFLLVLGILLAGCRKEPAPNPVPKADATAAERPSSDSVPAGTLAVKLLCGKDSSVAFYDDTAGDDANYVRNRRADSVFSDSGYFVERTFYEGGDWVYVSKRNCAELMLYGRPVINPARTRFASVNEDLEAGFMANGVQIVSLEAGLPQVKLEDKLDGWGPYSGAWTDDSTFVADLEDGEGHRRPRTYALRGGTWAIREDAVKNAPAASGGRGPDAPPYPEVANDSGPAK